MKQPEDNKTLDLLKGQKRGRGRPPVEHALTPAERAKRCRDKKKRACIDVGVTKIQHVTEKDNKVFRLECEISALKDELDSYRRFQEQRVELDDFAQLQFDGLARENKRLEQQIEALNCDATKNKGESVGMLESRVMVLNAENGILGRELEDAKARIDDLCGALEVVVKLRTQKKGIPADVLSVLSKLLIARPKRKQSSF